MRVQKIVRDARRAGTGRVVFDGRHGTHKFRRFGASDNGRWIVSRLKDDTVPNNMVEKFPFATLRRVSGRKHEISSQSVMERRVNFQSLSGLFDLENAFGRGCG